VAAAGRATATLLDKLVHRRTSAGDMKETAYSAFSDITMLDSIRTMDDAVCAVFAKERLRNDSWVQTHALASNQQQYACDLLWKVSRRTDGRGMKELHAAAGRGMVATLRALVCDGGVDPCNRGRFGQTALHIAAARGHVRALELLCALVLSAPDRDSTSPLVGQADALGWTALHHAAFTGQLECVRRLVECGCGADAAARDGDGQTPADVADGACARQHASRFEIADSDALPRGLVREAQAANVEAWETYSRFLDTAVYLRRLAGSRARALPTAASPDSAPHLGAFHRRLREALTAPHFAVALPPRIALPAPRRRCFPLPVVSSGVVHEIPPPPPLPPPLPSPLPPPKM
jgi:hypothetical protein